MRDVHDTYSFMKVKLGVLKEYLDFMLVEGRVDDARDKFPDMEDENFEYLVANQPAGSNNKYLMWACKQADELLENDPDPQGLRIVVQAIRLFDGNKQRLEKKDLNQYKDMAEVETAVEKLGGASKGQQAKQARADSDAIYNDEQFTVIRPHTAEASCKYGIGTKWCIAATASRNYFNTYASSNNKFYFIIDKHAQPNSHNSKLAIVINDAPTDDNQNRIQVFNAPDHQVGLQTAIRHCGDKWPAIWAKIKEHVAANPSTREVEDAQKETKEHVKNLLSGEKVSAKGLEKIAKDAELTTQTVSALIKRMREYTGPVGYEDPRQSIISRLTDRANQLKQESALELIKYIPETKSAGNTYWSGRYSLESLIKNSNLSHEAFMDLVAKSNNDETLSLILRNPNCPANIVGKMAERLPELRDRELKNDIFRALILRGNITADQMQQAMTGDARGYGSLAYEVLAYPQMSANLSPALLRLVPIKSSHDLKKMLALPNVPADMSADLISTHWNLLKKKELYELLRDIKLPIEMIDRIWTGKDQHIRTALLQNPSIGAENAKKFANSRNSAYRFAVAHNTVLPAESLQTLAGDESASTRSAVASNANTPAETLKVIASDEANVVRASVASNLKTPRDVLNALTKDSDEFVRKSARKTLKSLGTAEAFVSLAIGMHGHLLTEELADDDTQDIMTPQWTEIPRGSINTAEFISVFLLQNNGHASREEVEDAFQRWNPQHSTTRYSRSWRRGGRRHSIIVPRKNVWQVLKYEENYNETSARSTSVSGKGWWWSPPGINKGSVLRLTPAGASAAMEALQSMRTKYPQNTWTTGAVPPVKKTPPARALDPNRTNEPATPRGPKTTYKIYGKFKGHPAATRLKGKAYVAPANTQFSAGEQAFIEPGEDGKLKVKKADGDHTQDWDPIDG